MTPTPVFQCEIKNNKITLPTQFLDYTKTLADGTYQLVLKKKAKPRSNEQNRYYWGGVLPIIGKELGYTTEEAHEALKWKFLRKEGKIPTVRSTAELTTSEFIEYTDSIKRWAAEFLNIFIPDPDGLDLPDYY